MKKTLTDAGRLRVFIDFVRLSVGLDPLYARGKYKDYCPFGEQFDLYKHREKWEEEKSI